MADVGVPKVKGFGWLKVDGLLGVEPGAEAGRLNAEFAADGAPNEKAPAGVAVGVVEACPKGDVPKGLAGDWTVSGAF